MHTSPVLGTHFVRFLHCSAILEHIMKDRDNKPGLPGFFWIVGAAVAGASVAVLVNPGDNQLKAVDTTRINTNKSSTPPFSSSEMQKVLQESGGPLSPIFYGIPNISRWEYLMRVNLLNYPNVDINQASTLMLIESRGNPDAESYGGALGLFQLLPSTFKDYTRQELLDPATNISLGISYLSGQLNENDGNFRAALASYNGGPAAGEWYRGLISRYQYDLDLVAASGPKGPWPTISAADAKASQVSQEAYWAGIYDDAKNGTHIYIDKFMGR